MISDAVAVSLAAVGASLAVSGLLILARREPSWPASLLALAGLLVLAALSCWRPTATTTRAAVLLVPAVQCSRPLALLMLPDASAGAIPIDLLAVTAVAASGAVSLVLWDQPGRRRR